MLRHLNQLKHQVIILGDINIDFLRYVTHQSTERYLDMLYTNNFIPIITKPTRITDHTKTLIDHIYINKSICQAKSGIAVFDISDHLPVFSIINAPCKRMNEKRFYRDYKSFNKDEYIRDLSEIDWHEKLRELGNNLHQATKNIIDTLEEVTRTHAPIKEVPRSKLKQIDKPWITNGILKSIKVKQRMYRSHFFSNDVRKVAQYKQYANKLNKIKAISKTKYYNNQFEKYKTNLKATWKLIGNLIKRQPKGQLSPSRLIRNGIVYTDKHDIANQFNQHFVNVGINLANKLNTSSTNPTAYIRNSPVSSFVMSNVTESQVRQLFLSLDGNKSSNSIPNTIIKISSSIMAPIFTSIYNESINTGVVPNVLKISRITPIYKNGLETDPNNFRPISILSPFAKVLERLIYNQLECFLTKNKLIFDYQFGFRKGHSTEQAILEITDRLKSEIDNKKITCGLFLDFSKAFDTVDYEILLAKLYKYGIRGTPLTWFSNYLNNRQQYVKIGNTESDYLTMTCGVPQGSTLGPLLFILYINDMPNCSNKLSFRIFADDSNVFYSSTSIDDVERVMNEELNHIFQYCDANKLSVNINKTNFMVITSNKRRVREIQLIRNIKQKNHIKYLGIYIDKNLSWDQQISHVNNKLAKNTGIINKLRYYVDLRMLKQLYFTLIYPYINYGLMSWGNAYTSKLKKLRSCQNKCIRSIFFADKRENATPYYSLLGILKLDSVFKLKLALFTYKVLNEKDKLPIIFSDTITLASSRHSYNTRFAAQCNFSRPNARTNYGTQTFLFASSKIWETVDNKIKQSKSISVFKKTYSQSLLISQTQV